MTEFGLTPAGFNRKRLADFKTEIEDALKLAFGENIDLEPESGFGQFVGILSESLADQSESQELVYNSEYPTTASGAALSNVVQFNDIERQPAVKSTATVTITGTESTTIPLGSGVAVASTGEKFLTDAEVIIPALGFIDVAVTAEEFGPTSAASGTITVIDTPIFGWTSVTNSAAATIGSDEETDAELRERRNLSTLALGQNLQDSLFGQILNIIGVEDAVVKSNRTKVTDADGIPPNEFISVVSGGDVTEIANAIWKNTPQGVASFGALTEIIVDDQGFQQDVKYSRPADVSIYFKIDIEVNTLEFPGNGADDIKSDVVDYGEANFKISDDIILSEFYSAINQTPGIISIDLFIGLAPSPAGVINLPIAIDEISRYDIANVEVNIV